MFLLRDDYIYARLDEDGPSSSQVFGKRKRGKVLCFAAAPCIVIVIMAWHGLAVYFMGFRSSGYVTCYYSISQ